MENITCTYFEKCPICGSVDQIKLLWIIAYCRTHRFEECARYRLRQEGGRPAFTLLPDGSHMTPDVERAVREFVGECMKVEGRA